MDRSADRWTASTCFFATFPVRIMAVTTAFPWFRFCFATGPEIFETVIVPPPSMLVLFDGYKHQQRRTTTPYAFFTCSLVD